MEQTLRTVDIIRQGYGTRYTGLPVDALDLDGFLIDCRTTYMRPELYDLRLGDQVRWLQNGRYQEGSIHVVERTEQQLRVVLVDVILHEPEYSPY